MIVIALAVAAAAPDPAVVTRLARMTELYDKVCLRAFPDDDKVDLAMAAMGAEPLSPENVKVTLGNDPGRGWALPEDPHALLFVEAPPYHACSLRWPMPERIGPLPAYRALAAAYEAAHPGFAPATPYDGDRGAIHIHAEGEMRRLPDGGAETLYVFDQHINDPARRAKGETGTMLRFVHQLLAPGAR